MAFTRRRERPLFSGDELDNLIRHLATKGHKLVDEIHEEQFLVSTDEQIIDNLRNKLIISPINLIEESITMTTAEGKLDVSGYRDRNPFGDRGPIVVPSTIVTISVPYIGDQQLWEFRPNPYTLSFPEAAVNAEKIIITLEQPSSDDETKFKQRFNDILSIIKKHLTAQAGQILPHNKRVDGYLLPAILSRRERLDKLGNLSGLLGIPLEVKSGAPVPIPVRVSPIHPPKPLPKAPKSGVVPEHGITDQQYDAILKIIKHWGRTAEGSPTGFAKLDEEELRDTMLANLNGHFEGAAAGERFRKNGKTDICITEGDREAFVGECKIWAGPKSVSDALDQLLGYLTWRDSKAALIFFNTKIGGFVTLLGKFSGALEGHRLKVEGPVDKGGGEWSFVFRSEEDEGRRVMVRAFLFDLYSKKNK